MYILQDNGIPVFLHLNTTFNLICYMQFLIKKKILVKIVSTFFKCKITKTETEM